MSSLLDAKRIAGRCAATRHGLAVEVVAVTGSTNADLRLRADQLRAPVLLAAEQQTAGRGRAGRRWLSAPEDSLCFSLAWRFPGSVARLAGLPLAVGVVLADTLRSRGHPVTLKWPNDLLLEGDKLGGILVETTAARPDCDAPALWAVIGVGLNVRANRERDHGMAAPVAALGEGIDRNELLAVLADALAEALTLFDAQGLAPFIDRWQRWHAFAGLPVMIVEQGQRLHEGIARGIDAYGCLLLDTASGTVAVAAGDLSLRPQAATGKQHAAAG
jgi:BirA family biotin operon repressor/biotin-[acetyl-CoA-carboxylase] ligase